MIKFKYPRVLCHEMKEHTCTKVVQKQLVNKRLELKFADRNMYPKDMFLEACEEMRHLKEIVR